tara:strand:+ start:3988 stop:4182 length:195 start_codon:yes stop_codon:yes gene_type:complete
LPSTSSSNFAYAWSSPFLKIDEPFCPGCNPSNANCNASKTDVFPAPISPAKRIEPEGNSISNSS